MSFIHRHTFQNHFTEEGRIVDVFSRLIIYRDI